MFLRGNFINRRGCSLHRWQMASARLSPRFAAPSPQKLPLGVRFGSRKTGWVAPGPWEAICHLLSARRGWGSPKRSPYISPFKGIDKAYKDSLLIRYIKIRVLNHSV